MFEKRDLLRIAILAIAVIVAMALQGMHGDAHLVTVGLSVPLR